MLYLSLDGVDPGDIKITLGANNRHDLLGDDPQFSLSFAGQGLDFEPDAEAVFSGPDMDHFGAGIAFNHVRTPRFISTLCYISITALARYWSPMITAGAKIF